MAQRAADRIEARGDGWLSSLSIADALGTLREVVRERDDLAEQLRTKTRECDRLLRTVEDLRRQNHKLKADLEEAQRSAKRQAAPFRRKNRKRRRKKPGRKKGHEAARRPMPDHIDEEVVVPLDRCPRCNGPVEDVADLAPQVVVDLPPEVKLHVRRYHTQSGHCPACRRRVRSRHADQTSTATGAAGVQIGPKAMTLASDLRHRVGVTANKVPGVFALFFGLRFCPATLIRAEKRWLPKLEPTYQALVEVVRSVPVVNADETGWYVTEAKRKAWLWVFAAPDPRVTLFAIRTSRGVQVPEEILGADFAGTLGIDGWAGYDRMRCSKGQCNGHLLRRAVDLLDVQVRGAARFPLAVKRILLEAIAVKALAPELSPADYQALVDQVRGQMQTLLEGRIVEPANLRFARHLVRHQGELFTFLDVPLLEATNNLAEREIRPAVILRKISAGNRTLSGARAHEVMASLSRTAERNNRSLAPLLPDLLRSPVPYVLPLAPCLETALPPDRPKTPEVSHELHRPNGVCSADVRAHGRHLRPGGGRGCTGDAAAARPPPPL